MTTDQLREEFADILRTGYHGIAETKVLNKIMQKVGSYVEGVIGEDLPPEVSTEINSMGVEYQHDWSEPVNAEKAKARKRAGL